MRKEKQKMLNDNENFFPTQIVEDNNAVGEMMEFW